MHLYYDLKPTDPLVAEILADPTYHYDLQEIQLPADKRSKLLASVEFLGLPVTRSLQGSCTQYYGTSGLFGLAAWPEFGIVGRDGATVPSAARLRATPSRSCLRLEDPAWVLGHGPTS